MKSPELDYEARRRLLREAERLLAKIEWQVTTLLKMSKLEAGTISLQKDTISVKKFLADAVSPFELAMDIHVDLLRGKPTLHRAADHRRGSRYSEVGSAAFV